jgi:hypothetical protein
LIDSAIKLKAITSKSEKWGTAPHREIIASALSGLLAIIDSDNVNLFLPFSVHEHTRIKSKKIRV